MICKEVEVGRAINIPSNERDTPTIYNGQASLASQTYRYIYVESDVSQAKATATANARQQVVPVCEMTGLLFSQCETKRKQKNSLAHSS